MIALIIRNDPTRMATMSLTLMDIGFQVMCVESLVAAEAMSRGTVIDVVVADERIGNDLTHRLLLSIERRNPAVSAFVMTDKVGADADELFLLMPSVYALMPLDASSDMLTRLVRSAMAYDGDGTRAVVESDDNAALLDDMLDDWQAEDVPVLAVSEMPEPISAPEPAPTFSVSGGFQSVRTPVMH